MTGSGEDWRFCCDTTAAIDQPCQWGGIALYMHTIIIRAAPSALTVVGAFLLPLLMVGMIEASATRRLEVPWTRLSVAHGAVLSAFAER